MWPTPPSNVVWAVGTTHTGNLTAESARRADPTLYRHVQTFTSTYGTGQDILQHRDPIHSRYPCVLSNWHIMS